MEYYAKEEEETNPKEDAPAYTPFGDVPKLPYPIQMDASGSSSAQPPIWDQILET